MARSTTSKRTKTLHTLKRKNVIIPRLKEQIIKRTQKLKERITREETPRGLETMKLDKKAEKVVVNGKNWRAFMEEMLEA